ncbi:MAG: RICIN domain-containing protein [Phycisphaerae bacterium]|nr:RICIN domain-containing protein [Phycisphaerae bacterium]
MTQAALLLYRLTGDDSYLQEAQVMGAAMEHEFVNKDTHALKQTGKWGGHDMTNAYVALYEVDRNRHWLNIAAGYLEYLYVNGRDAATGRYPTSWDRVGGAPSNGLIDNASAARALWKMAGTVGGAAPVYVNIVNRASGRCLRVYASQTADGTGVVLYDISSTSTSQMLALTDQGNGYYTIRSWSSDKAVEPLGSQTADNTTVVINRADARQYAQQWRLIDLGNGYFNIQNRLSGKSMQPRFSGTANNTQVVTNTTEADLVAQQWRLAGYTAPTSITPYVSMDEGGRWDQTDRTTAEGGDRVMLKGEAPGDGMWQWTGPNGFSATGRVVTLEHLRTRESGNYVVTFTNAGGAESYSVVRVNVAAAAKLFQHCSYGGWMAGLGVGAYTTADLAASGVGNNDASSIKVAPGYTVTLFDYNNFQGPMLVRTSDDDCFVDEGWNDRASSLIIEGAPGAAAHWRFDEGGGTTIVDASGYGRNGTCVNMEEGSWGAGKRCGGLSFDGVDDSVRVIGYSGVIGDAGRTCMAWIKTTQVSGEILSWGREARSRKWIVRVDESGRLRVEVQGGYAIGTAIINDGLWHHAAVVIEDDECADIADAKLYVDGRRDALSAWSARPVHTEAYQNVRIGVFVASQRYFEGQIDEVRIYDRPLNSERIWELFLEHALVGDVEADGVVDLRDFAALAERWRNTDSCDGDLNCDCSVDMEDFAILAGEWLSRVE